MARRPTSSRTPPAPTRTAYYLLNRTGRTNRRSNFERRRRVESKEIKQIRMKATAKEFDALVRPTGGATTIDPRADRSARLPRRTADHRAPPTTRPYHRSSAARPPSETPRESRGRLERRSNEPRRERDARARPLTRARDAQKPPTRQSTPRATIERHLTRARRRSHRARDPPPP